MGCLRLFLAVAVVVEHAPLFGTVRLFGGTNAVEIFFMLSGFYMALVLDGKYGTASWTEISTFYLSRFFRLWPTFLLTTLAGYALWLVHYVRLGHAPMAAGPIMEWAGVPFAIAARFSNVFMIGQDVPSWFHVSEAGGLRLTFGMPWTLPDGSLWAGYAREIGPAWSIGTEIWFYLLAPFLMRARSAALLVLAAAGLGLRYYMVEMRGLTGYFFFPTQLPLFLAGALAYRARDTTFLKHRAMALLPLIVVLGWTAAQWVVSIDRMFNWAFYLVIALGLPALFASTKDYARDRTIGELSYPVYIVHMLLAGLLSATLRRWNLTATGELLLLLVLPVSYAIFQFVERPVDRWRQTIATRRLATAAS